MKSLVYKVTIQVVVLIAAFERSAFAGMMGSGGGMHGGKETVAVPEPSTLLLLGIGALGVGYFHNRTKK